MRTRRFGRTGREVAELGLEGVARLRLPGDLYFIVIGVLPLLYLTYLGVRHTVKRVVIEEPEDVADVVAFLK